jgi:hypothetical protein
MHLTIDELVDVAEGTRTESSAPHLGACEHCRKQLWDLRAAISTAKDVDVPEPSPLFWDHLSSRVAEAVAAEGVASRAAWVAHPRYALASLAVAAALLIAVSSTFRRSVPPAVGLPGISVADSSAAVDLVGDPVDDDPSLTVVASLIDDQDIETVREAGLAPRESAEHAVAQLSDEELRELGRLLRKEITRSGA